MTSSTLAGTALIAVAVLAAGCSSGGTGYGGGGSSTPASQAAGSAAGPTRVALRSTPLGSVLTDGAGRTLYMYSPDRPGTSACSGQCLVVWPALAGRPSAGAGASASLLGTITRSDGSTQATYAGHPLYRYAGDTAPGDVAGEGIQGIWWVLDAHGAPVRQATGSSSSPAGGVRGY